VNNLIARLSLMVYRSS